MDNSIKFTEEGGVTIVYYREDDQVVVEVSDSGIGIPEGIKQFIFEAFRTGDFENIEQYGGTGLGLAIVKKDIDLLGGSISCDSSDQGTTITVRLPDISVEEKLDE